MDHQLSFGVDRDVLVEELRYYFEQTQAAVISEILPVCGFKQECEAE